MKKISGTLVMLFVLTFFLTSAASASIFRGKDRRVKEIKERLITLRNWQLMEEFDLKGQRAQRVFQILSKYDDEREKLILKRRRLLGKLRNGLETGDLSDNEIKGLIRQITDVNIELARIPRKEIKGLEAVFSPRELARYLLFSQRFAREARRLIGRSRALKAKPGGR